MADHDPNCGQPWADHIDDGIQMLCPEEPRCTPESPSCEAHRGGRSWLLACPDAPRCTCAATNAVGATSPGYRCNACADEIRHCDGRGEDYDPQEESHVGHELSSADDTSCGEVVW